MPAFPAYAGTGIQVDGNEGCFIMRKRTYNVYILASKKNGTLYTGMTNDLQRRMVEHMKRLIEGFTKRYGVHRLVYYEQTDDVYGAIRREKQIKKWYRKWKIELIELHNPGWNDLADSFGNIQAQIPSLHPTPTS